MSDGCGVATVSRAGVLRSRVCLVGRAGVKRCKRHTEPRKADIGGATARTNLFTHRIIVHLRTIWAGGTLCLRLLPSLHRWRRFRHLCTNTYHQFLLQFFSCPTSAIMSRVYRAGATSRRAPAGGWRAGTLLPVTVGSRLQELHRGRLSLACHRALLTQVKLLAPSADSRWFGISG